MARCSTSRSRSPSTSSSPVRGVGQAVGEDLQQHRQPGGEHRTGDHQSLRIDRGVQMPADQRQVGVDLLPITRAGPEKHCRHQHLGPRAVQPGGPGERHPQPDLDQRAARLADRDHGQAGVQLGPGRATAPGCGWPTSSPAPAGARSGCVPISSAVRVAITPPGRRGRCRDDAQHGAATGIQGPRGVRDLVGGDRRQQVRQLAEQLGPAVQQFQRARATGCGWPPRRCPDRAQR